jgi:hypothetical protein
MISTAAVGPDTQPVAPDLPFAVGEVERVAAPDAKTFARRYLRWRRPVVLTGLTDGWLPLGQWTLDRMARVYGTTRVVAAALVGGTLDEDPKAGAIFRHVQLGEFIESLAARGSASNYVMAPTWNFPEAFKRDYRVPDYCARAWHMRAKVWVGKAGTVTPLHVDVPHNLHVHLSGRKRWLLVPPSQCWRLYLRGPFSGMPAFARVDPEHPDYERYPRFRGATVFAATLAPGETLFIPQGWWHHTRSLDDTVSMNFWWGGKVVSLGALASTLFKRTLGIRRDEWG